MKHYDLAIIGGGSAGLTAATIAGRVGARTALIDKERIGGDCLWYGCVPSKALIKCAKVAHAMRGSSRFGVSHGAAVTVDVKAVMSYVWDVIHTVQKHDDKSIADLGAVALRMGGATFVDPHRLRVGDDEITADKTIVCVGSHAVAPPIPGLEEAGYLDHVAAFHLEALPRRLGVVGGGPVGVELGQAFARLGAEVTILQAGPRLLPRDDAELAEMLEGFLAEELTVQVGARVTGAGRQGDAKYLVYEQDGEERRLECDEILVAVGRRPSLDGLGLAAAGVEISPGGRGILVDPSLRTTRKGIWAAGDCTGELQFTHYAEAQARIATRNALFVGNKKFTGQTVPWTTFSDPELAHVGLTEDEARQRVDDVSVYRYSYGALDRALCDGEGRGLAKVVCGKRGKILGASLLGPQAGEAIAEFVIAIEKDIHLNTLSRYIHVYPTMNRIVRRVADQRFMEEGVGAATRRLFGRFEGAD